MEPAGSSQCSQQPATCPYPEQNEPILFHYGPFYYYPPICAQVLHINKYNRLDK